MQLKMQVLVSAVNQQVNTLAEQMNLQSDAIIVNQCDSFSYDEFMQNSHKICCYSLQERGVGLSRNTALMRADAEIALFSDEDIVYLPGYEEKVLQAFEQYPDADVITFNIKVDERRRTYFNEKNRRIHWYNYGRYPAYAIAVRVESVRKANISYSLLFGGGAKYSNGEDSLFLHDCLKKKLRLYANTAVLGEEIYRESTWFSGYHEKFFVDRGVLYHYLYGGLARLFSIRFLYANRREMLKEIPFAEAYRMMKQGIREASR